MKYTKKVSVGNFLKKGVDFKGGDTAKIKNEGQQIEGQYGTQDVFLIEANGKEGNVSFNQTSINNLIEAFGEESANWVGKEVKIEMIRQNVQGKITPVYYFLHPSTELDEESGRFVLPNKKDADLPEIDIDEVE